MQSRGERQVERYAKERNHHRGGIPEAKSMPARSVSPRASLGRRQNATGATKMKLRGVDDSVMIYYNKKGKERTRPVDRVGHRDQEEGPHSP